jgi:hypothetical protein
MSFVGITDPDAFMAATQHTIWAATALASTSLVGATWALLNLRLRLLPRTRLRLLLSFGTVLSLLGCLAVVGWLYAAVFDPWHHVSAWCYPPPPFFLNVVITTPAIVTVVHVLTHRSRRPA